LKRGRYLKFTAEGKENCNRSQEVAKSKRSKSEYFGVPELTLRKKLKLGKVPNSLCHVKIMFSNEKEKKFADNCKDIDELQRHRRQILLAQLVKKFSAFYGNRRFITAFTRARPCSLF
jgi:hypothetical protein